MRGKGTSIEDKARVLEAKLSNPGLTLQEIEEQTGIHYNTVKRILDKAPEVAKSCNKDEIMCEKLLGIVDRITDIQEISMGKLEEKAVEQGLSTKELKDLTDIGKTNRDRTQILKDKPTEIKKVDIDLSGLSLKELEEKRKEILNS